MVDLRVELCQNDTVVLTFATNVLQNVPLTAARADEEEALLIDVWRGGISIQRLATLLAYPHGTHLHLPDEHARHGVTYV
ncbi:hypothetical protein [Dyella subtropica]|uniref:hypothetical protein n=1 Tax=Dyella subtropica TaxID=2992127 RepID=UPI0022562264|nr:hypothetical protein [Dyella subtropica]